MILKWNLTTVPNKKWGNGFTCPIYADCILTLPVPISDEKKKVTSIFIFALIFSASEGFMKALKAFIKPFEAPQRSAKIKI